jgi:toxin ParE1/3/4
MARVRYSRRAEDDLLDIGRYTLETWGAEQANRYLFEIEACCQRLAENWGMGRSCDEIRRGLRKMPHRKHIVYYWPEADGVQISRILHRGMSPELHSMND